jgi:DNA replication licensing factor MCM6
LVAWQLQRYIRFARTIQPKLTEAAQKVMVSEYRKLRQGDSSGRVFNWRLGQLGARVCGLPEA